MKKSLPRSDSESKGFTLIEILLVVAIIAILATIGFAIYSGLTGNARDAERQSEIKEIANALEINRTASGYQPLQAGWFQANAIPTDTLPSQRVYCIAVSNSSTPAVPAVFTNSCPSSYSTVSTSTPTADSVYFRVCATLEKTSSVFCIANSQ